MNFNYSLQFHPVGQGLFATGTISSNQEDIFRFVYDCGTSSSQSFINKAISNYFKETNDIDLLVISHFDNDHISGIDELLSKVNVKNLLLPYISLEQRIFIAFSQKSRLSIEKMKFYIDPIQYLTDKHKNKIQNIYIVPPSTDSNERENETQEQNTNDQFYADVDGIPDNIGGTNVVTLKKRGRLIFKQMFEFHPYNDDIYNNRLSKKFINAVTSERKTLLESTIKKDIAYSITKIKNIYDTCFGSTAFDRNVISLFLYAAPTLASLDLVEIITDTNLNFNKYIAFEPCHKTALFFCGDGMLDSKKRTDNLLKFYGPKKFNNIACFQVMHHGAKSSWHEGIAQKFKPLFSVFSSDPTNRKLKHPHPEVTKDFMPYNPIPVDKTRGIRMIFLVW